MLGDVQKVYCYRLYMPYEQMVLHTLYLVSMLVSIVIPLNEIHRNRSRVEAETGGDIMPYVRYTWEIGRAHV